MTLEDRDALLSCAAPSLWKNFRLCAEGEPATITLEARLYSDAWPTDEARDIGPLSIINGVPHRRGGSIFEMSPIAVMRLRQHRPVGFWRHSKNDSFEHYHGGTIFDEAAALIGLILDIRSWSGPIDREFGFDGDALGRPRVFGSHFEPAYNPGNRQDQIPRFQRYVDLSALRRIAKIADLCKEDAVELMKAARLFQNASWLANSTPEMSWLLYVAAAETIAVRHDATSRDAMEKITQSHPNILRILNEGGASHLAGDIALEMQKLTGATGKFVKFIKKYTPDPPQPRPESAAFDFSPSSVEAAMKTIYGHRSRALHGGTAFPLPMCNAPHRFDDGGIVERPDGLATHTLDTTWVAETTPMLLGTFSYIVRGAILKWWDEAVSRSDDASIEVNTSSYSSM